MNPKELPIILLESPQEWEQWLDVHHADSEGAWLKIAKKASGKQSVSYAHAVEVALCYGWIDGQARSFDVDYYVQKFTPRRPRSLWSKVNTKKAEALIKAGKMKPAGLAAIEAAKHDGRWDRAYDSHATSIVPDDFQAALDANPKAKAFFITLNKTNSYAILWHIQTAKKPETRQARIEKFIAMLAEEKKPHP